VTSSAASASGSNGEPCFEVDHSPALGAQGYARDEVDGVCDVLGPGVAEAGVTLFQMDAVAKHASCKPHTIARKRGIDLPTGRWVRIRDAGGSSRPTRLPRSSRI
jgi:hypothetical protein